MNICADLHTHSLASTHAYSTIAEMCHHAATVGLRAIAITDHGPTLPDAPHMWHFDNIGTLPRVIEGVFVLRGMEANILDIKGGLDACERPLDFIIASMHHPTFLPISREAHTEAWLAAVANPLVDCLGHAGRPEFHFDHEPVVKACADNGTAFEINNASFVVRKGSADNCKQIALLCKKHAVPLFINSDAHTCWHVGKAPHALAMLAEIEFPESLIINGDWERFTAYFKTRKQLDIPATMNAAME